MIDIDKPLENYDTIVYNGRTYYSKQAIKEIVEKTIIVTLDNLEFKETLSGVEIIDRELTIENTINQIKF